MFLLFCASQRMALSFFPLFRLQAKECHASFKSERKLLSLYALSDIKHDDFEVIFGRKPTTYCHTAAYTSLPVVYSRLMKEWATWNGFEGLEEQLPAQPTVDKSGRIERRLDEMNPLLDCLFALRKMPQNITSTQLLHCTTVAHFRESLIHEENLNDQWLDGRRLCVLEYEKQVPFSWSSHMVLAPRNTQVGDFVVCFRRRPENPKPRGAFILRQISENDEGEKLPENCYIAIGQCLISDLKDDGSWNSTPFILH
ncbi:hypothetical protein DL98DRAFT_589438 [Cadophora sp. DSE1049]|nr:hypothetical protein DL98DRAFT_589438 [Cadophora sp. DSE1049]